MTAPRIVGLRAAGTDRGGRHPRTGQLAQVLPDLTTTHRIYLLNHCPRGMLPSVRSLIDYLLAHMPASIQERSVDAVQKPWAQHPPG